HTRPRRRPQAARPVAEPKRSLCHPRPLHGFTLVELLVVVAIIATLMAILLPSLKKARAVAKQTQCMANQKQVYMAEILYESDYGVLAYDGKQASILNAAGLWATPAMYPYLNITLAPAPAGAFTSTASREKSPLFCPDAPRNWRSTPTNTIGYGSTSFPRLVRQYRGFNTGATSGTDGLVYSGAVRSSKAPRPGGIVFHVEGWEGWVTSSIPYNSYFAVAYSDWITSYHGLNPTKLYFDGHADIHAAGYVFPSWDGFTQYQLPPGYSSATGFMIVASEAADDLFNGLLK
ncbi:MAG: type II secretion system protein, partial [Phycisphaerales bacterium]